MLPNGKPAKKTPKHAPSPKFAPAATAAAAAAETRAASADPPVKKHKTKHGADVEEQAVTTDEPRTAEDVVLDSFARARVHYPEVAHAMFDAVTAEFTTPTPIQANVWAPLLARRDVIGIAATGSGKTLAFVLPAVALMMNGLLKKSKGRPRALVLSPTRELCVQSFEVAKKACAFADLRAVVCYGGQPRGEQKRELERGVDFLIATPGRLLDFVDDGVVSLRSVRFLVLDEADRMLDMGFERDVRRILAAAPPSAEGRQTLMFSATWPESIRSIASEFLLADAVKVALSGETLRASASVEQHVYVVEQSDKERRLVEVLKERHDGKNRVIVFALYKKEAERLEGFLKRKGYSVAGVHGDKTQPQREAAVASFVRGDATILVATDVAARGLDIKGVELVINVTFPLTIEDYVHRIGRTGRAGATGVAVTFFTEADKLRAGELQNVLRQAGVDIPEALLRFGSTVKKKMHDVYGAHFKPGACFCLG